MLELRKTLAGNIGLNLLGNIAPLIAALACMPFIIRELGKEQFAVLALVWLFIGYFSVLDLGIGRATTNLIIEQHQKRDLRGLNGIFLTSTIILLLVGVLIGILLAIASGFLVESFFKIPNELKGISKQAFLVTAFAIPFVTGVSSLRGVLEAEKKFRIVTYLRVPSSVLTYLAPALTLTFTNNLLFVVIVLSIVRLATFFGHLFFCARLYKSLPGSKPFQKQHIRRIVSVSSWLAVSNLIGPIMVYFDRLIVGSILSLTLLAFYTTPFEMVTKLLVISGSIGTVLFTYISTYHNSNPQIARELYDISLKGTLILLSFPALLLIIFATDILFLWVGPEFADQSKIILQILSLGVLINSLSSIPYTAIQAVNRADIPAKIHLAELPLYLLLLWLLASKMGIEGVAWAWTIRSMIDLLLFVTTLSVFNKDTRGFWLKQLNIFFILPVVFCVIGMGISDFAIGFRLCLGLGLVIFMSFFFWRFVLKPSEKNELSKLIRYGKITRV